MLYPNPGIPYEPCLEGCRGSRSSGQKLTQFWPKSGVKKRQKAPARSDDIIGRNLKSGMTGGNRLKLAQIVSNRLCLKVYPKGLIRWPNIHISINSGHKNLKK